MQRTSFIRMAILQLLTLQLLLFITCTATVPIETMGLDVANLTGDGADPKQYPLAGNVLLSGNGARTQGILFAFSVFFRGKDPVTLQVYRPTGTLKAYRLIAEFKITPSVPKGREDIYIESLLNRRCISISPGDRLGVYIPTDPTAVQMEFDSTGTALLYRAPRPPVIGDNLTSSTNYPVSLRVEGYIATSADNSSSNSSSSSDVGADCILGLTIPGAFAQISTEATTVATITGAPGARGVIGPVGDTGSTGPQGPTGVLGLPGVTGIMGATGFTGPRGATGSTGVIGPKGGKGLKGATGATGPIERGDIGSPGSQGPPGEMGRNRTIYINRLSPPDLLEDISSDTKDPYWSSSRAIWATYIWLAILSFLLLVVAILIVVIVCSHVTIWRPARSPRKKAASRSNILEETPSSYSDLDSQY